jgi:hypothetical protein
VSDKTAVIRGLRLNARLSYPTSNVRVPSHYATIRVEDEDSGMIVVEVELDPEELFNLMANRTAYGTGFAGARVERYGKRRVVETVHLDRAEWGLTYSSDETHAAIRANVKAYEDAGWTVDYRRAHGNHTLVCTRWEDRTDEMDAGGPDAAAADA